jgi:hypothetical protein
MKFPEQSQCNKMLEESASWRCSFLKEKLNRRKMSCSLVSHLESTHIERLPALRIEHLIQAFSTRSGIPETVATTANHQLWNVGLVGYNLHTLNGQTLRFISREEMNSGKSSPNGFGLSARL